MTVDSCQFYRNCILPSTFCNYNDMGTIFFSKITFFVDSFHFQPAAFVFYNLDRPWRHQGDEFPPGMERDNSGVNIHLGGLMLKEL